MWQGVPVERWFVRRLFAEAGDDREPGHYRVALEFDQIRMLTIEGKEYPVRAVSCEAEWVTAKKRKWVSLTGDGFYDWHKKTMTFPGNSTISGSYVKSDLLLWDDFDGEIPTPEALAKEPVMTAILVNTQKFPDDLPVPELEAL